uniref:CUT domain-containing protein n=1 Tax=Macrostomum lignano TaxID=282301 RepID=A0A1I8FBK3_9PLAT
HVPAPDATPKCSNLRWSRGDPPLQGSRAAAQKLLNTQPQWTSGLPAACSGELLIGAPPVPRRTNPRHRERHGQAAAARCAPASPRLSTRDLWSARPTAAVNRLTELLAAQLSCRLGRAISLLLRMLNYESSSTPANNSRRDSPCNARWHGNLQSTLNKIPSSLAGFDADLRRSQSSHRAGRASEMSSLHAGASAAAAAAVPAEASAAATEAAKDAAASSFLQSLLQASPISSELSSSPQISPMSGCAAPPAPGSRTPAASGMSRGQALHVPASTETPSSSPGSSLTNSISNAPSVAAASYSTVSPLPGGDDPMLLCPDENVVMETETGGFSLAGMLSPSAMREFRQIWPIQPGDVDELMQLGRDQRLLRCPAGLRL